MQTNTFLNTKHPITPTIFSQTNNFLNTKRLRTPIIPFQTSIQQPLLIQYPHKYGNCYLCKLPSKTSPSFQCKHCLKITHQTCLQSIISYSTPFCIFCNSTKESKCVICLHQINPLFQIILQCDICNNYIHYNCSYTPLSYLLYQFDIFKNSDRAVYSAFVDKLNQYEFYIRNIYTLNQVIYLRSIIELYYSNIKVMNDLNTKIKTICKYCSGHYKYIIKNNWRNYLNDYNTESFVQISFLPYHMDYIFNIKDLRLMQCNEETKETNVKVHKIVKNVYNTYTEKTFCVIKLKNQKGYFTELLRTLQNKETNYKKLLQECINMNKSKCYMSQEQFDGVSEVLAENCFVVDNEEKVINIQNEIVNDIVSLEQKVNSNVKPTIIICHDSKKTKLKWKKRFNMLQCSYSMKNLNSFSPVFQSAAYYEVFNQDIKSKINYDILFIAVSTNVNMVEILQDINVNMFILDFKVFKNYNTCFDIIKMIINNKQHQRGPTFKVFLCPDWLIHKNRFNEIINTFISIFNIKEHNSNNYIAYSNKYTNNDLVICNSNVTFTNDLSQCNVNKYEHWKISITNKMFDKETNMKILQLQKQMNNRLINLNNIKDNNNKNRLMLLPILHQNKNEFMLDKIKEIINTYQHNNVIIIVYDEHNDINFNTFTLEQIKSCKVVILISLCSSYTIIITLLC